MPGDDRSSHPIQDLSRFRLPPGFRGRSDFIVQLWWIAQALLIHASPQVMYGWRRLILRLFGARIGKNVKVRPSVRITYPWKVTIEDSAWIGDGAELYSLAEITIGHDAVVSQGSYLCTGSHDYNDIGFPIVTKPIVVEPEFWIAAQSFVTPGVTIGRGAVVGVRSLVLEDVPAYTIVAGHPAVAIGHRDGT